MRTIRTKVYSFDELSETAKEVAIEERRNAYYEDNDFALFAVDDDNLFEPNHHELMEVFGEYPPTLTENLRKKMHFSVDQNYFLDCENALYIPNNDKFLQWLGIKDKELRDQIYFTIYTPTGRDNSTAINFSWDSEEEETEEYFTAVDQATEKFNDYIDSIIDRIRKSIDYYFSDEAITEDLLNSEDEFLSNGKRY